MLLFDKLSLVALGLVVSAHANDNKPPEKPAKDPSKQGERQADIIDLGLRRIQKQYAGLVEALSAMRSAAPPVDHSDWYRGNAKRALFSRLEEFAGARGPVRFALIRKALEAFEDKTSRVSREFAKLSKADQPAIIEGFLGSALVRADGRVKTGDVIAISQYVTTPLLHQQLFVYALSHANSSSQTLDLLALALSKKSFAADPPSAIYEPLYFGVLGNEDESWFLESFLRTRVLKRVAAAYDRAVLLRSLEPVLTEKMDEHVIAALSEIGRAEWLPLDASAMAQRILRRWQFTGLARARGLEDFVERALSVDQPATRRPLRVCAALLLGHKIR